MKFDAVPQWLGWTWLIGALAAIVGSVLAVVVGLLLISDAASAVQDSVATTRRALTAVEETTTVVDGVFGDVAESLRGVQETLSGTSLTLTRASVVTSNLAEAMTEDVPASVDAVRDTLPALIDTARVIDRTMRGLSFVGVEYDPAVPLDESLVDIDRRLEEIPEILVAQRPALEGVASDLGGFASSTVDIADDLGAIRVRLSDASSVLAEYGTITEQTSTVLDELERGIRQSTDGLRVAVVLVGLGIAATQTLPLAAGWRVVRGPRREG